MRRILVSHAVPHAALLLSLLVATGGTLTGCNGERAASPTPAAQAPEDICLSGAASDYRDRVFTTLVNVQNFLQRITSVPDHRRAITCIAIEDGGMLNEGYAGIESINERMQATQPPSGCEEVHAAITKAAKALREAVAICSELEDAFSCREMRTSNCVDTDLMAGLFSIAREQSAAVERRAGGQYQAWLDRNAAQRAATQRERAEAFLQ